MLIRFSIKKIPEFVKAISKFQLETVTSRKGRHFFTNNKYDRAGVTQYRD